MYTYETKWNGLTLEIFKGSRSVGFYQGDDAQIILEKLELCETDEQEQDVLEQYDSQ